MHTSTRHREVLAELRADYRIGDLCELITFEALYQTIARATLAKGILVTREQFVSGDYAVVTNCDGLMAIVKAGLQLNLLAAAPAQSSGRAARG